MKVEMATAKRFRRYVPLAAARAQDLSALAESIADHYCPALPVQPELILKDQGISLSFNHYGDAFDGLLEHRSGSFHVYCNLERVDSPTSPRSRFTLGHELGHFFIDEHRNALLAGNDPHYSQAEFASVNPVEVEADHFASSLLLPEHRFIPEADRVPATLAGVVRLADRFGTSITSTAIRYAKLGIKPCAVIRWTADRYSWKWLSPLLHQNKYWTTIEDLDSVLDDSATGKILKGGDPSMGILSAGSVASAWFRFVAIGSFRDFMIQEHAMSLGRFGALTMLFPLDETLRT